MLGMLLDTDLANKLVHEASKSGRALRRCSVMLDGGWESGMSGGWDKDGKRAVEFKALGIS